MVLLVKTPDGAFKQNTVHSARAALHSKTANQMFGSLWLFVFKGFSYLDVTKIQNVLPCTFPCHLTSSNFVSWWIAGHSHWCSKQHLSRAAKILEIIEFRAQGYNLCGVSERSRQSSLTCKCAHVHKIHTTQADKHTHTHKNRAFVLLPQLFPSERGWLVGGRRGLATGAGQRNSGLFTFSHQPSLFRPFSLPFPLSPSPPHIPLCSLFS